jgi:hypothetical protein
MYTTASAATRSNPVLNFTSLVVGSIGTLNLTSVDSLGPKVDFNQTLDTTVQKFSDRAIVTENTTTHNARVDVLVIDMGATATDLKKSIFDTRSGATNRLHGANFFNWDIRGVNSTISSVKAWLITADTSDNSNCRSKL